MKMMEGLLSRASWNSCVTSFSLSPSHLLTRSLLLIEKKVLSASVATACGGAHAQREAAGGGWGGH